MTDFQVNPKTGQETAFFVTPRRRRFGSEIWRGPVDSPCFRTETDALEYEIPWSDYRWNKIAESNNKDFDVAHVVAVEADSGTSFAEGGCSGVIVYSKVVRGPRRPAGSHAWVSLYQPPNDDWARNVAEPFNLLSGG